MATVTLVTGGCRSGKSSYALAKCEELGGHRTFIATCVAMDDEMALRVRRHRKEREGRGWLLLEEPSDLEDALSRVTTPVVLVDCLSLWVNNLMHDAATRGDNVDENYLVGRSERLLAVCDSLAGTILIVTNEVGLGIVPANALARQYRDLLGRCNQIMAAGADEVVFMVSGIAARIK